MVRENRADFKYPQRHDWKELTDMEARSAEIEKFCKDHKVKCLPPDFFERGKDWSYTWSRRSKTIPKET